MRRTHPPSPFQALCASNDNGATASSRDLTPLARRGTRLCGTAVEVPPGALDEIRTLIAHRARYAEALRSLADGRDALTETLAEFR
ncbi:hypothetical protein [Acuticoccus yangtzensis]|uniref:hypothetical protein n=1 Tax=Acuticoccus yangtzensis TaxID=1443441 RepID=UPI0009496C4E|nr:hypothetical protein [Acuticoccus yangtzensis]ORE95791.1 hypothetical protein ATO13_02995 [Stappia sp. 22II-S9-Z10]